MNAHKSDRPGVRLAATLAIPALLLAPPAAAGSASAAELATPVAVADAPVESADTVPPVLAHVEARAMAAAIRRDTAALEAAVADLEFQLDRGRWTGGHAARAHTLAALASFQGILLTYGARTDVGALAGAAVRHTDAAMAADSSYGLAYAVRGMVEAARLPADEAVGGTAMWFSAARRHAPNDPRVDVAEGLATVFVPGHGVPLLRSASEHYANRQARSGADPAPDWWAATAHTLLADALLGSFGGAGQPEVDLDGARRALARALAESPSFEYAREVVAPWTRSRSPLPLDSLPDVPWTAVVRDPAGDGATEGWPDGVSLAAAETESRVWFRFQLDGALDRDDFGVNVAVDVDADSTNGAAWWGGSNSTFRYDRLVLVWVRRDDHGWAGLVGVGDARGPRIRRGTNVTQEAVDFALDRDAGLVYVAVPRWALGDGPLDFMGAVGTDRRWNDDLPDTGAARIGT